jgi:hypothetical protein
MSEQGVSASDLLQRIVPDGLEARRKAAANGEALYLSPEDEYSFHCDLWDLTMKLRISDLHANEVIQNRGVDRLLQVLQSCLWASSEFDRETFVSTATTQENRKKLISSMTDAHYTISCLHELCRYRSGCEAIAKHLPKLLPMLPLDTIFYCLCTSIGFNLFTSYKHAVAAGGPFLDPAKFHVGMIEQGLIDTIGRTLHGLDKNKGLRKKVAKLLSPCIKSMANHMTNTHKYLNVLSQSDIFEHLHHCIKLESSMAKLETLVKEAKSNKPISGKAWRSIYRLERQHLPTSPAEEEINTEGDPRAITFCHFCQKVGGPAEFMRCSRWYVTQSYHSCGTDVVPDTNLHPFPYFVSCSHTAVYCSKECQRTAWRVHKKECVKQRGFSTPSDWTQTSGFFQLKNNGRKAAEEMHRAIDALRVDPGDDKEKTAELNDIVEKSLQTIKETQETLANCEYELPSDS